MSQNHPNAHSRNNPLYKSIWTGIGSIRRTYPTCNAAAVPSEQNLSTTERVHPDLRKWTFHQEEVGFLQEECRLYMIAKTKGRIPPHKIHLLTARLVKTINLTKRRPPNPPISNINMYICRRWQKRRGSRKGDRAESGEKSCGGARKLLTKRVTYQPFLQSLPFSCRHCRK